MASFRDDQACASANNGTGNSFNQGANPPPDYEHFMFNPNDDLRENNERILSQIDNLEAMVEKLRIAASEIEEEKQKLTKSLIDVVETTRNVHLAAGHREEMDANVNRIMTRLLAVDIRVNIPRTAAQEQAYQTVKNMLEELQTKVDSGLNDYQKMLGSYLNACSTDATGITDSKFQAVILSCTLDDQKQVRKLLQSWLTLCNDFHLSWSKACKSGFNLK